ncbi:MAG TPA: acyltransferase [Candidatus Baltobacteraceae bacterium]|nr:acyltransferase [Candidatus Baltobacteraceae bacterium]
MTEGPELVTASHERRLAVLDGLRGIAILLVVWYHVWLMTWLRADVHVFGQTYNFNIFPEMGYLGVEIFFFISGFCLFYPYARTLFDGKPQQTLGQFAWRRGIKILPSYTLSIVILVGFGLAENIAPWDVPWHVFTHMTFIHPLFANTYGSINGVLWSLGIEVQFYVIFPLLCWAAVRSPLATFLVMFIVANAYRQSIVTSTEILRMVNQLPAVLDLFAAGMACAYAFRLIAVKWPAAAERRALWTGVAVLGIVCYLLQLNELFSMRFGMHDYSAMWQIARRSSFAASLLLLTLGSLFAYPLWQRALANPVLLFLSLISYNLYLWHQVIGYWFVAHHIPGFVGLDPRKDPVWQLTLAAITFAAALAIATFLTFAFERPLLRWRPFEPRPTGDASALAQGNAPAAR